MSASGRAADFMQAWGEGHNRPHNPGHKAWGADDCDACTAEAFDPWEALVHAARIAGFLRDEQAAATAPPRPPTASVSDQGADPRTPTTPGAVSGHSGPREEDAETFTVDNGHYEHRHELLTDAEFIAAARTAVPRLLALVAAQADQIAELRADVASHLDAARGFAAQANEAEAKLARVRALLDSATELAPGSVRAYFADDIRAALDGTEATP